MFTEARKLDIFSCSQPYYSNPQGKKDYVKTPSPTVSLLLRVDSLLWKHVYLLLLPSNGSGILAYLAVVVQYLLHSLQYYHVSVTKHGLGLIIGLIERLQRVTKNTSSYNSLTDLLTL